MLKAAVLFACRGLTLAVLSACLVGQQPALLPELPVDSWTRDPEPILSAGVRGADGLLDTAVADPDALYDADLGAWHLWYQTGRGKTYTDADSRMVIRHAASADGAVWSVDDAPALSLPDEPSAWDSTHTETPSVVLDPAAAPDRRYRMYYSGANGPHPMGFPEYRIGLAFSADGRTFRRLPANESPYGLEGLVLAAAEALPGVEGFTGGIVADPEVQLVAGVYHLWFSSFANGVGGDILAFGISHATSADGINWIPDPANPIPGLRDVSNAGGQQPSVTWNPALKRWEMWFTSDSAEEAARIPSAFNPALGFWRASSTDALVWTVDYQAPRDVYWRPRAAEESLGLLTGAEVVIVGGVRHLFYTGWGSVKVPEGFLVPVRDSREFVPAVLNLIHATRDSAP